ncbi:DUF2934 domain-containing protein [Rhizobium cauense]|uniref:DUF2934 domain-containing protein n=1 Tax=Rhizobium cauense TaxID=1166683 RepID=UPI001CB7967C|nr:DUF2934 domain-containing protein [Rhizobium cauense]
MARRKAPVQGTHPDETAISVPDTTGRGDASADLTESIRRRAYEIWESEGSPDGRPDDHWRQAEQEILKGR